MPSIIPDTPKSDDSNVLEIQEEERITDEEVFNHLTQDTLKLNISKIDHIKDWMEYKDISSIQELVLEYYSDPQMNYSHIIFKKSGKSVIKREVLIFLTPHLVRYY